MFAMPTMCRASEASKTEVFKNAYKNSNLIVKNEHDFIFLVSGLGRLNYTEKRV